MPYHVEVRRGRAHARVFNLGEEELAHTVVEPWRHGRAIELGDRRWERAGSALRILHGPPLEGVDLAYGRGWSNAERSARDVTGEILAATAAAVAVLACNEDATGAAAAMLERLGLEAIDWREAARAPILGWLRAAEHPVEVGFAAALVVGAGSVPDWWLFEAGIALGALGPRALLMHVGGGDPPSPLRELDVLRVGADPAEDLERLRERLRRAGCALPSGR